MDELYRKLIEEIPEDLTVQGVAMGETWLVVKSQCGGGIASVYDEGRHERGMTDRYNGMTLREMAAYIETGSYAEKGLGVAAINAYYNQMERLNEKGNLIVDTTANTFTDYEEGVSGKDVVFVGHFCGLEMHMKKAGRVSVLEKRPGPGDYPAEMCDEIIPGKDYAFITGATLPNGTLPHILDLCRGDENLKAVLVGPTTTMSEILFERGADELSGFVVDDVDAALASAVSDDRFAVFKTGVKLRVTEKMYDYSGEMGVPTRVKLCVTEKM